MANKYTEDEVRRLLLENVLFAKKPIGQYSSDVYNVFDVIYDANDAKTGWYICRSCDWLKEINSLKKSGNSQMTRHQCYIDQREPQPQQPEEPGRYVRALPNVKAKPFIGAPKKRQNMNGKLFSN